MEGYTPVKDRSRELYKQKRFSEVVGNPGMVWEFFPSDLLAVGGNWIWE